jgi:hypothetical protein
VAIVDAHRLPQERTLALALVFRIATALAEEDGVLHDRSKIRIRKVLLTVIDTSSHVTVHLVKWYAKRTTIQSIVATCITRGVKK